MKTILNMSALIILFTSFTIHAQSPNQSQGLPESNEELTNYRATESLAIYDSTSLDSFIVAKMEEYHFPGLAACIIKDDTIIWKGNYGYAQIRSRLVTESTLFCIASISKTFTATAVMQLWEQGLFDLDDDVNDYLPFNVRNPNHPDVPITFRMLLTHTSGINGWTNRITFGADSPIELGFYMENYLVPGGTYYDSRDWNTWIPGTKHSYSDESAALLGYLVETITNISFEQYCQDSIFVPLGMNETSWFLANLDQSHIAMPYTYSSGKYYPDGHRGWAAYPAAQLRTSSTQLARFLTAYMQKGQIDGVRILNSSTVDSMTKIHDPEIHKSQGLIWYLSKQNIPDVGERIITSHAGGGMGVRALIGYLSEAGENFGSIVIANQGSNFNSPVGVVEISLELLSYGIIKPTDIGKKRSNLPGIFALSQNYPNPFNPITMINYQLSLTNQVDLSIYNIIGQKVATLVSTTQPAGNHQVQWDASGFASGIYYYKLEAGEYQQVRKMILLR